MLLSCGVFVDRESGVFEWLCCNFGQQCLVN